MKIKVVHCIICTWLTLLYFICMTLVVFSLTTYQLQHRIFSTLQSPPSGFILKYHDCEPTPYIDPEALPKDRGLQKFLCIPLTKIATVSYFSPGTIYHEINSAEKADASSMDRPEALQTIPSSKKEAITDLKKLIKSKPKKDNIFLGQYAHLKGVIADIKYHEKITSSLFGRKGLWAIPEDILIVILIFSMGALGSLIFLTMEFLKRDDNAVEKFSMYFFRPMLGMVMALAVFVMFRSGQYSMGIESEQHLSPFFISFMSIISGMMSEKFYGSLKLQGEKLLPDENNES